MKKVLIVDDSLFIRAMIRGILVKNGYEVIAEACDGDDAISKYKEFQPDIVTMDITMPGTNGIIASKEILKLYLRFLPIPSSMRCLCYEADHWTNCSFIL